MKTRLLVLVSIAGMLIASFLPTAAPPLMAHTPTEDVTPRIAAERQLGTTADTISPSAVVNLTATTGNSPGTVNLSWIAPGDDATTGTAAVYIVRYNTTAITDGNWSTSIDVTGEPTPSPAGTVENLTVSGLTPGQVYHFAVKAQDEVPNLSGVSNSPGVSAKAGPFSTYLPLVASSASVLPIIPATTNVLTQTTTQYLSSISDDGVVFAFTQWTPALRAVAPGEIIVGDVTTDTPYGFLRKVTAVSPVGGQVVVTTTQATLEDAIETGTAHISQVLTLDQIQEGVQAKGVALTAAPQSLGGFYLSLENVVLYDDDGSLSTTDDQIKADGSIRLEPGFDFSLVVRDWQLKELAFTTSARETAEIKLKAEVELVSIKKEKEIARYTFSPITVMVGVVPIVIVPVLTVNVGVDGNVHIGLTAGVEQQATLLAGLRYAGGVWQPVSQFSNQFSWTPPTLFAGLDLKGYAGNRLSLLLYGVVGPYADINAYLKLEADTADDPWWTLSGGLEVPAGVKVEVLGHSLADYEGPTIAFGLILAQAQSNTPPNLPFAPYPGNGALIQNLNTDLSWSGGDLDGDAVTYDIYFEAGDDTPDVLVSNDQIGIAYDLGALLPNTHYYWRIVAQDEHGATTPGPVWDFATATGATCPIALTLELPQVNNLTATINGTVSSTCSSITRLNWQWGDGVSGDQWFPASHTYTISGTYAITVTAYNTLGDAQVQMTTVHIGTSTESNSPPRTSFRWTGHGGVVIGAQVFNNQTNPAGTITITDVPPGASIVRADFYTTAWSSNGTAAATFQGQNLGTSAAIATDPERDLVLGTYRWDVTSLVAGNGSYSFASSGIGISYAAMLVIVYQYSSDPIRQVIINDGGDSMDGTAGFVSSTSTWANITAGQARLIVMTEADDNGSTQSETVRFNGLLIGSGDVFHANLGQYASMLEWDVQTTNGQNAVTITTNGDWFGWHLAILEIE